MATPTNQFRIKLAPSTAYNFSVEWGDGMSELFNQTTSSNEDLAGLTHTYTSPNVYNVSITQNTLNGFPRLFFNGNDNTSSNNDDVKVIDITQWGSPNWSSMGASFDGCTNLSAIATDNGNSTLSGVTNFENAWRNCTSLTSFPLIDTSKGTNFHKTWAGCTSLSSFPLINTLSATNFVYTWASCYKLKDFPLIESKNVTNFNSTWDGCTSLTSFPLIDFSKASSPYFTWAGCKSLSSFPLIDTSNCNALGLCWWQCENLKSFPLINTSKVGDFDRTWGDCFSLTSFPLIDTLSATVRLYHTWENCRSLKTFPQINTKNTTNFDSAWSGCLSLTAFPLINTSEGTNFSSTWYNCIDLSKSEFPTLDMSKMTNGSNCFAGAKLTTSSYSSLLTSLCATNFNSNVQFHGGLSNFNQAGKDARDYLLTTKGWTIGGTGVLET